MKSMPRIWNFKICNKYCNFTTKNNENVHAAICKTLRKSHFKNTHNRYFIIIMKNYRSSLKSNTQERERAYQDWENFRKCFCVNLSVLICLCAWVGHMHVIINLDLALFWDYINKLFLPFSLSTTRWQ